MVLSLVPLQPGVGGPTYAIELVDPDGGEVLITGQPFRIKWTVTSSTGYIHIGLTTDGGTNWTEVAVVGGPAGLGTGYDWRVPYVNDSSACRIRVVWTDSPGKMGTLLDEDESASDFNISRDHWLDLKDIPDVMTHGRYCPVPWELLDPDGEIGSLDLEVSVDEGSGWSAWTSAGTRFTDIDTYLGVVYYTPPNYNRSQGRLRLVARDGPGGTVLRTAESTVFEIRSAILTLIDPNGGVALVQGETYTVEWRVVEDPGELINGYGLFYSTDGGGSWATINASIEPTFSYDWTVPSGSVSDTVRIRVEAYFMEFDLLDEDASDADNRIIPDGSTYSVTLVDPNPPATGHAIEAGGRHTIEWSCTGGTGGMTEFQLAYSTDSGGTWTDIGTASATARRHRWDVPMVLTEHGRVRVRLVRASETLDAVSNNDLIIYRRGTYNTPPVAVIAPVRDVHSGDNFPLDGTGSWDMNHDTLTYNWTVVRDWGFNVTIYSAGSATPRCIAHIGDYNLTIVLQLRVDDGGTYDPAWPFYTDRVSIRVIADTPRISGFSPSYGWAGTNVTVSGEFQTGTTFLLDDEAMYTVPRNFTEGDDVTFTLREGLPLGQYPIEARNLRGSSISADEFEVHPAPMWPNDWGLADHNPTDDVLTYPWLLWEEGSYKDTFGEDQVYQPFYVCIGVPWWDPWTGYSCLGYEYEESLVPDPLAALYYGIFYHEIARWGECYGMSATALQLYHSDEAAFRWNGSARFSNELSLANDTEFNRNVDMMQGSQLSVEILEWYMLRFLEGLEPSFEFPMPPLGMGLFLNRMETAVIDHELGIITMIAGDVAHAVVPWKVVNIPYDNTVRIYVYDCNKEWWSTDEGTWDAFNDTREIVHTPAYIEVDKTGGWWEWTYQFDETTTLRSTTGIAFIPYSVINGPRTLPTDWDSMTMYLVGDATTSVEDVSGNRNYRTPGGDLVLEVPDSVPAPAFMGPGDDLDGWLLANGTDFTTTIRGDPGNGVYNWSVFWNGTSAFAIQEADVEGASTDTISMEYPGGNPMRGRLTYGTTDAAKGYSFTHVKAMGAEGEDPKARQRTYSILDAKLHGDSQAIINTTDDYDSLVFQNRGPHTVTLGVEFRTNVLTEAQLNATGAPDHLPTARLMNVEVGPYEIVTFTPSDWLDLDNADILVGRETPELVPPGQVATFNAVSRLGTAYLTWTPPEDDGGAVIDGYIILRGPLYNETNQLARVDGTERSYVDDTVTVGETYFYKVRAVSVAGPGRESPAVGVWVQQGPARPGPPTGGTATAGPGEVRLTWEPPDDDGGGTVTGYRVLRADVERVSGADLLAEVGNVTGYVDDVVEANTTYHYFIEAVNEAGHGTHLGPIEVHVPAGDGDGDGDGGGAYPVMDLAVGATMAVAAAGVGILLGRRIGGR